MFRLTEIRKELKAMTIAGRLCNQTWGEWRDAAGIGHYAHTCTRDQWIRLCACAALQRRRKKVNAITVEVFLKNHGDDPLEFLPGLLPLSQMRSLPTSCSGREIADIAADIIGHRPTENTVKRWLKAIGAFYSRNDCYSATQVQAVLRHAVRLRVEASDRARLRAMKPRQRQTFTGSAAA